MGILFVISVGLFSGALLGALSGFGLSAHASSSDGFLPSNKWLALFVTPTDQLQPWQTLFVFFSVLCSLPISLGLLVSPLLVSNWLESIPDWALYIAFTGELAAIFPFRWLGAKLWRKIS